MDYLVFRKEDDNEKNYGGGVSSPVRSAGWLC